MNYDVIGDIHGQAGKLSALLRELGCRQRAGTWVPPVGTMAVFVGDLIDRGPEQLATLDIVRGMVDGGHAYCVMGNHEFNAIAYATRRQGTSDYLRPHTDKNNTQHSAFLAAVEGDSRKYRERIDWFRTLPVALDLGVIRAVHAWWNADFVQLVDEVRSGKPLDDTFMHAACTKGTPLHAAMEGLTKGCELELPDGHTFADHEGVIRREVRVRWWMPEPASYRDYAAMANAEQAALPDVPVEAHHKFAPPEGAPVFVGHYWFAGALRLDSARVACVDYSAAKEGLPLVAYRWQGEPELTAEHFVFGRRLSRAVHHKEVIMGFQVIYIDNYSAPGEGASYAGGSFASYEEAVGHCKRVVDSFLEEEHKPGMSAEQLWERYAMFGEDATVCSGTGEQFSGWDYATHRCALLCGERAAAWR